MSKNWQKQCECKKFQSRVTSNNTRHNIVVCNNCGRYPPKPVDEDCEGLFGEVNPQAHTVDMFAGINY